MQHNQPQDYIPRPVAIAKRALDLSIALSALLILSPLLPLIALLIKLDSPGPVIYRQQRIGRCTANSTELIWIYKFRSMRTDAESAGAVWASQRDPRITRLGAFLRKSRLDELPQLINVIRGDMSLVGPRPERPGFYSKLENAIPLFSERTYGLLPGITGLAQVNQGYDSCIEDVRRKVGYDHAYALSLSKPGLWLRMEGEIIARTMWVMLAGRGQ